MKNLPKPLRDLVGKAVASLGRTIKDLGDEKLFLDVERFRRQMKSFRGLSSAGKKRVLQKLYRELDRCGPDKQFEVAHAFSLMMELMNACENAYRTFRLERKQRNVEVTQDRRISFVFTAHPTEARSTSCIQIFRQIEALLRRALEVSYSDVEEDISALLNLAWKIPMAHGLRPTVKDEAEHIFHHLLTSENLSVFAQARKLGIDLQLRTWVGGDKDGHPGVGARQTQMCLETSRNKISSFVRQNTQHALSQVRMLKSENKVERKTTARVEGLGLGVLRQLESLAKVRHQDGKRVTSFHRSLRDFSLGFEKLFGFQSRELEEVTYLLQILPGLVVPLELRESADQIEKSPDAVVQMLLLLHRVSGGKKLRWYVRGFVISMVHSSEDLKRAFHLVRAALKIPRLPIVPLFETHEALEGAEKILADTFQDKAFLGVCRKNWDSRFEVMLGYSDSSKELGAWPSRFLISEAMHRIDRFLRSKKLQPIFFHGTGGSVARGGGSVYEQIEWWPQSARNIFKVTVQGEMIHRSFASGELSEAQVFSIFEQLTARGSSKPKISKALSSFTEKVERAYQSLVLDEERLSSILEASPYAYLDELRIGSRPSKRKTSQGVSGLRAIPWVLCWTQARCLFPAWWGLGSAWKEMSTKERNRLKKDFKENALFRSFVKLAGFTLEKVELEVFEMYLDKRLRSKVSGRAILLDFERELKQAKTFIRAVSGHRNLLWFRPWLRSSIFLRSAMIHPLNILQILALKKNNPKLLRETATGIASGMLTTG